MPAPKKKRDLPPLARALRDARRATNLEQGALAGVLAVSRRSLGRWEAGLPPDEVSRDRLGDWARSLPRAAGEPLLRALGVLVVVNDAPAPAATRSPDPRRALDDVILAVAEDLDVGARSLRRGIARVLAAIAESGMPLDAAQKAIAAGSEKKGR